ncbi:alpha/beta hydrolase [Catenovulum sp. 2E275]|uniref:alpha/beta hydrolase n=1 Tax=Catenovulum sp. 2E275 TaxID=2980497 RepID=UPI0021D383A7|nr:alpha/beta hydrolase [Catenovulum sp. 2E275]MCU4677290.1 alpha/beta hydrolase [Catenovulum sp. 2E275]
MKLSFISAALGAMVITGCASTSQPMKNSSTEQAANSAIKSTIVANKTNIQVIDLYPGAIPGAIDLPDQESIRDPNHPDTFINDVNKPQITVYQADPAIANGTSVIILPGGGYRGVSIVKEGYQIAERLNKLGITAFVLKYRMPNDKTMQDKKTGPLQDAQQAIHLVRENADKWGVDSNKVGIMGFSAGGHLASTAATHFNKAVMAEYKNENLRPDFQILIYPVISMKADVTHKGSRDNLLGPELKTQDLSDYSNEDQINAVTPKAFIVHANDDKAVPVENSLLYVKALAEYKIQAELVLLPAGGHGFGMRNPFDWFESMTQWFKNNQLL